MILRTQRSGFTLVELIIVIIILAILAVLAVPQFTSSTTDAKRATLQANLGMLQKAIQYYKVEHDQRYPTARIAEQLTQYTKVNGQASPTKSPPYKFGPYLIKIPENPMATGSVDSDGITVEDDSDPLEIDSSPTTGWKYNETTGEIIPNVL